MTVDTLRRRAARRAPARVATGVVALTLLGTGLVGCSGSTASRPAGRTTPAAGAADTAAPSNRARPLPEFPWLRSRVRADVLVVSAKGLAPAQVAALRRLATGGFAAVRVGEVTVAGRKLGALGVDPVAFRAFTPQGTAEATPVWQSVARGEVVVAHEPAKAMRLALGKPVDVSAATRMRLRVGAFATPGLTDLSVVVADDVAADLGLVRDSGAVLSAGGKDPVELARTARATLGPGVRVDLITEPAAPPTAFLRGSKAAKAFGAFSYRFHEDGTIEPDPRWVAENIRYATVPVIGTVRCHRLMIPQLRKALAEVEAQGLGPKLYSFAGCYVPRFIERDTTRGISLHTWGIAVDFNVATNQVGTHGDMDPRIVRIFEKWGFSWGGRWAEPDPMHFELAALLDV
jgi:hypothetical protein